MGKDERRATSGAYGNDAARAVGMLRVGFEDLRKTGVVVHEVRIKAPGEGRPDTMVILKAKWEGRLWVAFHSAYDPEEAFRGAMERLSAQTLKWHPDKPWGAPENPLGEES